MAPKPGANLFLFALYMVTVGVFKTASTIPPEWRPNLSQPFTAYAVSSFFYTATGLLTLCQIFWCPLATPPGWSTRCATVEAVLICLQGFWSYWSDVVSIGAHRTGQNRKAAVLAAAQADHRPLRRSRLMAPGSDPRPQTTTAASESWHRRRAEPPIPPG